MFGTFALRAGVARLIWHCVARLDGLVAGDAAALCVAAWHLWPSTFALRGRGGTYMALRGTLDAAALCVAGVALGDSHLRFAW